MAGRMASARLRSPASLGSWSAASAPAASVANAGGIVMPSYPGTVPRRPPRHDHDAGGPADLLAAKAALRTEVWSAMTAAGAARFPGAEGRIPNFVGAEAAAERLRRTDAWTDAASVKSNPDAPQWPVRQRALEDGKIVYMAVPRFADERPFFLLDPAELAHPPR